jgi:poly-gamma-glutamate synthesis protein (capsule biosynthesis protein)
MLITKTRKRRRFWILFTLTILIAAVISIFFIKNHAASPSNVKTIIKKEVKPSAISSTVLFTGNTYWGRYINDWSMASPLKYQYPFSRLSEFNRNQYNAWISGLECPTVAGVHLTSAEEDSTLAFNCSPDYLPEAAKWFTAFTLANNHTDNQGADGFAETKTQLDKNNIQYFGNPDPGVLDDICEVISLPVSVVNDDNTTTTGFLPVAECAYHAIFKLPLTESVAKISEYSPYMTVVATPHMGVEYKSSPDQLKINLYRSLVDAGADMVMGDHPHWIQNSESYNGHLIVYSMGNFIFDQQDTSEVVRSAAIKVVLSVKESDKTVLEKWLEIGKTCKTYKDDCLNQIKTAKLKKLDISYVYSVVGTDDGDRIVKPASPEKQLSILQRLDWANTIKNLQTPYSGL